MVAAGRQADSGRPRKRKRLWRCRASATCGRRHRRHRRAQRPSSARAQLSATCGPAARSIPLLHGADLAQHVTAVVSSALIHPETHFTDEKAGPLRQADYRRLRRHWQFINELQAIRRSRTNIAYGVHVYGSRAREPRFLNGVIAVSPGHGGTRSLHPRRQRARARHQGS